MDYFFEISNNDPALLRKVFGTTNELTFAICATGSGGMETAVSNFVEPGTKVASFANGYFVIVRAEMADVAKAGKVVRLERAVG